MCFHHQVETFCAVYSWCYNLVKMKYELGSLQYCKRPVGSLSSTALLSEPQEKFKTVKKAIAFSKDTILSFSHDQVLPQKSLESCRVHNTRQN